MKSISEPARAPGRTRQEEATFDIAASPRASGVFDFTDPADDNWTGILVLAPHAALPPSLAARNDFYVVKGSLCAATSIVTSGALLSLPPGVDSACWRAGTDGCLLLGYRDAHAVTTSTLITAAEHSWIQGGVDGLLIAPLCDGGHRLMLAWWRPGTRLHLHAHPYGEDIFVLEGTLRDLNGSYGAGSWHRLRPGASHAPYADAPTLILIRNGHLRGKPVF